MLKQASGNDRKDKDNAKRTQKKENAKSTEKEKAQCKMEWRGYKVTQPSMAYTETSKG